MHIHLNILDMLKDSYYVCVHYIYHGFGSYWKHSGYHVPSSAQISYHLTGIYMDPPKTFLLVMCQAGPQALSPLSLAHSSPSQA